MTTTRPPSGSAISHALRNIFAQLPEFLAQLPATLQQICWDAVVPCLTALACATLVGLVAHRIHRILYPPGPGELHKEAVLLLLQSSSSQKQSSQRRARACLQQAVDVLLTAIQQDPSYAPAIVSLAALYIYKLHNGRAAIQLLETTLLRAAADGNNNNTVTTDAAMHVTDAQSLLLDAQALLAGQGHMIQTEIRQDEFLSLSYAISSSSSAQAAAAASASSNRPEEGKDVDSKKKR
jgi:hypothetical protein